MTEIRRVREDEEPAFLRLLCRVFDLDFSRASSIFFAEPLHDSRQNWGLFSEGKLSSICTITPLEFGPGRVAGISGVATRSDHRSRGFARELLTEAIAQSMRDGFLGQMLFAHRLDLYRELGFEYIDDVIRAPIEGISSADPVSISNDEVRVIYDQWALEHEWRLRREEARWNFWKWNMRCCESLGGGYLCSEMSLVREAIAVPGLAWPVLEGSEWIGLKSLTEELNIPVGPGRVELQVMTRGLAHMPQMFMTDQF